jgi:hypothetical protein
VDSRVEQGSVETNRLLAVGAVHKDGAGTGTAEGHPHKLSHILRLALFFQKSAQPRRGQTGAKEHVAAGCDAFDVQSQSGPKKAFALRTDLFDQGAAHAPEAGDENGQGKHRVHCAGV